MKLSVLYSKKRSPRHLIKATTRATCYSQRKTQRRTLNGSKAPSIKTRAHPDLAVHPQPKQEGSCRWCDLPNHWERECRKKRAGEPRKVPARKAHLTAKKDKSCPSEVLLTQVEHYAGISTCTTTHVYMVYAWLHQGVTWHLGFLTRGPRVTSAWINHNSSPTAQTHYINMLF